MSFLYILCTVLIIAIVLYIIHKWLYRKAREYYSQTYWDNRYSYYLKEMDWYTNFDKINKDFGIIDKINEIFVHGKGISIHKLKILEMGCGNSTLSIDLYKHNFQNITAIDFSNVIISRMQEKYSNINQVKFMCVDFNNLSDHYKENTYDIIIEKAGLDSIAIKNTPDVPELLMKVYYQMHKVLKKGGTVFSISSKNTAFWKSNVFERLQKENLFELKEVRISTAIIKENTPPMNVYFFRYEKI